MFLTLTFLPAVPATMAETNLNKTLHYGGRRELPTAEEIQATAVSDITVVDLEFTEPPIEITTLLKMGRYYSTTMCHYWDMSVNSQYTSQ